MKFIINVLYLKAMVPCIPCVDLKPLVFALFIVAIVALDQNRGCKVPPFTGKICLF